MREAAQMHRQGRLPDAERLYRAALAQDPKNFDATYLLGMLKMQQQHLGEAETLAAAAVTRNPASCDALMLLGSIKLSQKRFDEALGFFDRAVAAQPKNIDARYNRAVALQQAGRLPQALADYEQVVKAQPDSAPAWFNRGNVFAQLSQHEQAIGSYDRALALVPNYVDALNNRGNALAACGRHEQALAGFERLLAIAPDHADAASNRSAALLALGRNEEALAGCERVLAKRPDHVFALVQRGNALHAMEHYGEALADYDRALALTPDDVEIVNNRVVSLLELGRIEDALACAGRAVAMAPDNASAYFGRGKALQDASRHGDAIHDYERALALKPDFADAQLNLGMGYLAFGQFAEGWPLYESRWSNRNAPSLRGYSQPLWDGRPVSGTLLVWGEQGVGDVVMYSSLLFRLAAFAGHVIVEIDPRMVDLYARSFPEFEIVPFGPQPHAGLVEAHVPIGTMASCLLKSWDDFPKREGGFLIPDPGQVRALRERLASDGRRVVGLSWSSQSKKNWHGRSWKIGSYKSARLKDFEALLRLPGCRFVDLQYGDTAKERDEVARELGVRVDHLDDIDNRNDLDRLAALIGACDAVLTVSSFTAHLAGAVGTPTWVMPPFGRGRFWYWFAQKPTSPWYPSAQVRTQEPGQSWAELIARLAPEIAAATSAPWRPPAGRSGA